MKPTITFAQEQFLELLRAGLWGKPADPRLFPIGKTDWKEIFRIAKEQTVQVLVADGIETLPQENWPPKEALMHLLMIRVKTAQMHTLLNNSISQIVSTLNSEGIPSVLLKGQGVAQNYRQPESRMCGDIDLYVGKDNFEKASDVLSNQPSVQMKAEIGSDDLHRHFTVNGTELELHHKSTSSANKKLDKQIDLWTQESLVNHFQDKTLPVVNFNQTPVQIPSATYNAVFILHHAARHMITEGISLRQICDWTMHLHRHHAEINETELQETLSKLHMSAIWKEFGALAVNILSLNPAELPGAEKILKTRNTQKTTLLLSHLFLSGNFGQYDKNKRNSKETNILKRKWRSLCFQTLRFMKIFRLFPLFTLSYSAGWYPSSITRALKRQ